jgi:RNA recognition motif-containing protein
MSKRVFVGNLAAQVSDKELSDLFAPYGVVRKAEVVRGRGGRGRGFAYVELASDEGAARAIAELNGREILGRPATLAEARSAPPRPPADDTNDYRPPFRDRGESDRRRR